MWIVGMDRGRGVKMCLMDYGSADTYGESW